MTKSISLPPGVCNYGAELVGILMALKAHDDTFRKFVKQHPDDHKDIIQGNRTLVLLWVDNQEAIVAATASELEDKPYWPVVLSIHQRLVSLESMGVEVRLEWYPGHVGNALNDTWATP